MAALWAAHDLADHVVQTDQQAATKATSWRGMAGHIGGYQLTQAAALAALRPLGVRPSWRRALAAVALSAGTHALLDRRWPVVRLLERTGSARFSQPVLEGQAATVVWAPGHPDAVAVVEGRPLPLHGPYLADQALHHACLAVAAYVLAGGTQ
jgi:hypothetical protein